MRRSLLISEEVNNGRDRRRPFDTRKCRQCFDWIHIAIVLVA